MMQITIDWPDAGKCPHREFRAFLQLMANRYIQGHFRYGPPHRRKKYTTRAKAELRAYEQTGNVEHLANLANYCALEIQEPESAKQHFNAFAASVTRMGGEREDRD